MRSPGGRILAVATRRVRARRSVHPVRRRHMRKCVLGACRSSAIWLGADGAATAEECHTEESAGGTTSQ
jgi:hypothetical protein